MMAQNQVKMSSRFQDEWQKSLRNPSRPIPRRRSSISDLPNSSQVADPGGNKVRKLSVIEDLEESVFGNGGPETRDCSQVVTARGGVKCQRRRSSIPVPIEKKIPREPKRKPEKQKSYIPIPHPLDLSKVLTQQREPLISPIPLPRGVVCIDPLPENDSTKCYWQDFVHYLLSKEAHWQFSTSQILGNARSLARHRCTLMNWLVEVTIHCKVSQQSLYHTTSIIDSTLGRREVENSHLQLVGVTAFLIATKLEEYFPASIPTLLELTDNSFTVSEVLGMEHELLMLHDGAVHGPDPMAFISRNIAAAFQESNSVFVNTCLLFYDILIPCIEYSSILTSKKAAAAVYAAIQILNMDQLYELSKTECFERWTPTLEYYSGYTEIDLYLLGYQMTERVLKALQISRKVGKHEGVLKKFYGSTRHDGLMKRREFQLEHFRGSVAKFEEQTKKLDLLSKEEKESL